MKKKKSNQSGQAILEYMILLSITLGVVIAFAKNITALFDRSAPKIGGVFERQIRAGAAPAGLWESP